MTYRNTVAIAALSTVLLAAPAFAGSHMEGEKADMSKNDVFMKIDANNDSKLTFTEFANFSEAHGVSSSDAAVEFTRLAGEQTTINMDGFEDFNMKSYKGHKKDKTKSAMKDKGEKMMAPESIRSSSDASNGMSASMNASYGDFAKLDADSDGSVNFKEYHKMRKSQGATSTTQVAQEFTRLTGGKAMLSANQYQTARANDVLNQPTYRAQANSQVRGSVITNLEETDTMDLPADNNPAGLNQMNASEQGSTMTNSGAETDLDKTSNPQMKVWGDK